MVPRQAEPPVGGFSSAVADAIHEVLVARGMSGRVLATRVGRSHNYVATRLRKEKAFTLEDTARICRVLGLEVGSFLAGVSNSFGG